MKKKSNDLLDSYMNFTVKMGLVPSHDSNLNQSPGAENRRRRKEEKRMANQGDRGTQEKSKGRMRKFEIL